MFVVRTFPLLSCILTLIKFPKQKNKDGMFIILEDGEVHFNEYMEMIRQGIEFVDTEQELVEAFKVFDREGNGFINSLEIRRVMTNLGYKLTDWEVDEMVIQADLDGDGQINYEGKRHSVEFKGIHMDASFIYGNKYEK